MRAVGGLRRVGTVVANSDLHAVVTDATPLVECGNRGFRGVGLVLQREAPRTQRRNEGQVDHRELLVARTIVREKRLASRRRARSQRCDEGSREPEGAHRGEQPNGQILAHEHRSPLWCSRRTAASTEVDTLVTWRQEGQRDKMLPTILTLTVSHAGPSGTIGLRALLDQLDLLELGHAARRTGPRYPPVGGQMLVEKRADARSECLGARRVARIHTSRLAGVS